MPPNASNRSGNGHRSAARAFAAAAVNRLLRIAPIERYLRRRYAGSERPEFALRGSFLSPLPDYAEVEARAATLFAKPADAGPSIRLRAAEQLALLNQWVRFYPEFNWPEEPRPEFRYYLRNDYFCQGDALSLYAMLRQCQPRRIVEVGSGFSSALMLDVNDRFLGSGVEFTFVEPYPERLRSLLRAGDASRATVLEQNVQHVALEAFDRLEGNDVLFIDSSHVSKIGSDVNFLMFEVLPRLRPGVLVHFHDIQWPFEYPKEWIMEGRAWNEAYLVRSFLQYNAAFEVVLFNSFVGHRYESWFVEHLPKFLLNPGGSLWLRRTGVAFA